MKAYYLILASNLFISLSAYAMEKKSKINRYDYFLLLTSTVVSPQTADFTELFLIKRKELVTQQPDTIELKKLTKKVKSK